MIYNLEDMAEQIDIAISRLQEDESFDNERLEVHFGDLYHHLNTAWNGRYRRGNYQETQTDSEFFKDRQMPEDFDEYLTADRTQG
jgi:hypothetical protein